MADATYREGLRAGLDIDVLRRDIANAAGACEAMMVTGEWQPWGRDDPEKRKLWREAKVREPATSRG